MFVEISCPADINVFGKDEKVSKYQPIAREVSTCYNQPVEVIPIVFGLSGVVSCHQKNYLKKLPCYSNSLFQLLQQTALLGTISILREINFKFGANLVFLLVHHYISLQMYMCNYFNEIQY